MTNVLVIGDIVCTETGQDIIIGFTHDGKGYRPEKVILDLGGISDEEHFDVIGNYDDIECALTLHSDEPIDPDIIGRFEDGVL